MLVGCRLHHRPGPQRRRRLRDGLSSALVVCPPGHLLVGRASPLAAAHDMYLARKKHQIRDPKSQRNPKHETQMTEIRQWRIARRRGRLGFGVLSLFGISCLGFGISPPRGVSSCFPRPLSGYSMKRRRTGSRFRHVGRISRGRHESISCASPNAGRNGIEESEARWRPRYREALWSIRLHNTA